MPSLAALALLLGTTVPQAVTAPASTPQVAEPSPPGYRALRYEEDWTPLRDPARRRDVFDPIKLIPLDDAGEVYLTLGADLRAQYESYWEQDFGVTAERDGYLLLRAYPYADLHVGEAFRAFAQIKSCTALEKDGPTFPSEKNVLDLHQAFVDVALDTSLATLTLRPGRQELLYGGGRLIDNRSGPNAKISYDAVRAIVEVDKGPRVDAFYARPLRSEPYEFDDDHIRGVRLWGVYAAMPSFEVYYLGIERRDHPFVEGFGDALRHTVGARLVGRRGAGPDWNIEGQYQFGRFEGGPIEAWGAQADVGYTFDQVPLEPRLGCRGDLQSGDRDPGDGRLETYDSFFPRGILHGESGSFGPANLATVTPEVGCRLFQPVYASARYTFYWRQSEGDGIYSLNLFPLGGADSSERFIGQEVSITLDWYMQRHVIFSTVVSYLKVGPYLRDVGYSEDQTFLSATITIKI